LITRNQNEMRSLFHKMRWDRIRIKAFSCKMKSDLYEMRASDLIINLDMNLFTHLYYRSLFFLKFRMTLCSWHQFTWFLIFNVLVVLTDFICVMWAIIVLLNCAVSNFSEMLTHFFKKIIAELIDLQRHFWRACEKKSRFCRNFKKNRNILLRN